MEVFGLGLKIKEEGAATVEASIKRLGAELAKTVISVTAVTGALNKFVTETAASQKAQAQLETTLRATGGVSGQTAESINATAEALQELTAFGDDAIVAAQSILLMFDKIAGDTFPRAIKAVLDLAQALEMDLNSAAMLLGKALQSPVEGISALSRAKIKLSQDQEELIKKFVALNDIASAQGVLLDALDGKIAGSAEAYRNTLGGAIDALREAFGNLFEANEKTGVSLTKTINAITDMVTALRGPVQFVFSNLTNGLVVIGSLLAQVAIAIVRFFTRIGAAAATFFGAFGVLLPGVGEKIGFFIDDLNKKVSENDEYFAGLQKRLGEWRTEVVMGTEATKKLNAELGKGGGGGGTGGGGGMAAMPAAGASISAFEARAAEQFSMVGGKLKTVVQAGIPAVSGIVLSEAARAAADLQIQIQQTFQDSVANSLVGGVVGGIEQAVASGNIGEGFKAMTSMMLAGLGDAMIKFGTSTASFAKFMAGIKKALSLGNPAAGLAMSLALIGVGAALKGAARGMFGGQGGGGGGSMSSFGGGGTGYSSAIPITQITFGQTSATTAAGMTPIQPMNVTVIGPNDPSAQRAIQELMTKANRRGNV